MSYTLAADGTTVAVKKDNTTIVDHITNAVSAPFASTDTLHTTKEVFYSSLVWSAGAAVGSGIFTRRRAAEGQGPIGGFLF